MSERVEVMRGDSEEQLDSFQNATLSTVGLGESEDYHVPPEVKPVAVSIAVYPPAHWRKEILTEDEVALRLEQNLSALTDLGFHVEVMVGPDLDYEEGGDARV